MDRNEMEDIDYGENDDVLMGGCRKNNDLESVSLDYNRRVRVRVMLVVVLHVIVPNTRRNRKNHDEMMVDVDLAWKDVLHHQ